MDGLAGTAGFTDGAESREDEVAIANLLNETMVRQIIKANSLLIIDTK
jgi:hypothetical protein